MQKDEKDDQQLFDTSALLPFLTKDDNHLTNN